MQEHYPLPIWYSNGQTKTVSRYHLETKKMPPTLIMFSARWVILSWHLLLVRLRVRTPGHIATVGAKVILVFCLQGISACRYTGNRATCLLTDHLLRANRLHGFIYQMTIVTVNEKSRIHAERHAITWTRTRYFLLETSGFSHTNVCEAP